MKPSRKGPVLRILFVLPPTKTSNEIDTLRSIPGATLVTVGDPTYHPGVDIALTSRRLPIVGSPRRWTAALAWLVGLRKIEPGSVDVVITTELFCPVSVQVIPLVAQLGVPHVVLVQEILDSNPLYWMPPWGWYARRSVAALHGVLCSSPPGRHHVINRGVDPERVVVVPPGVDTSMFRPAARRPDRPTAIFVGELRPDKGIMDVIAACDLVASRLGPSFKLIVVGDGSLRADVKAAAAKREWLDYRGHIARDQVPDALRSASAFVIAPYTRRFSSEQFGFASVEAMACGLPVVTTRGGAIPEVVPAYNPMSAERDVDGLADGLYRALTSEGEVWGQMNRAFACDHYDLDRQGAVLGDELDTLIANATA